MEQFQVKQRTLIVRMPKELDHHMAEQIRRRADRMIAAENVSRVEFDFRDTDFMDSSGIGMIMGRKRLLSYGGGTVSAIHVNDRILRIMQLSGLCKHIEISQEPVWNYRKR